MLLVEYRVLDNLKVINEGTAASPKLKIRGKFQKCNEQNRNKRTYPTEVLTNQVASIQEKIQDRSLVGALDHPTNDEIRLSQASHLITKLWVEKNGDVMGEAEILSTPAGKIVEALINDGVKIGISSRGVGTVSEGENGTVVNNDFKLITFDLVSDPSTKGAYPELTESVKMNSQKAQDIVRKVKSEQVFLTLLKSKVDEAISLPHRSKGGEPLTPDQKRANISAASRQLTGQKRQKALKGVSKHTMKGINNPATNTPDRLHRASGVFQSLNTSTGSLKTTLLRALQERCWKGYEPVKGKKPFSKGSCKKK